MSDESSTATDATSDDLIVAVSDHDDRSSKYCRRRVPVTACPAA